MPFFAAAMVPATCVPWSLSPVFGRQEPSVVSGAPDTQLAEAPRLKFGARSGWVSSTPVSMTATVTLPLPSVFWCAWSALMAGRSHWRGSIGSWSAVASAAALRACSAVSGCATPMSVVACGTMGLVRVAPAESTALARRIVFAKSGFCDSTMMTPICS